MTTALHREAAALVLEQRWAALGTLDAGAPLVSMAAYALEPGATALLFMLSGLSRHTRNLISDPRASVAIGRPDPGTGDPQTLPRVSLQGVVEVVPPQDARFGPSRERYVRRFPEAAPRFELTDFLLFRLAPVEGRYVGGFARAGSLTGEELCRAARTLQPLPPGGLP